MVKINSKEDFSILIKEIALENAQKVFKANFISTPIGEMLAIADESYLYLLEFMECKNLHLEVESLGKKHKVNFELGENSVINSAEEELGAYFSGKLQNFKTPIFLDGSDFQETVWSSLQKIEYGKTCSYLELANKINRPTSMRAVANANGANQLAIIIPCHRVISANGSLAGYAGGVERKKWLLQHENNNSN